LKLNDREWKEFFIGGENGIFNIFSTSSSIDKNKLVISKENEVIPYITRSEIHNGINLFVTENQNEKYKIDDGNVITIGLDTQTVFYQPYRFFTGQNIQILKNSKLNKYNALFIIPLLKVQMKKFNWGGNGATLGRLEKTKLMLPVSLTESKMPDWEFMQNYIKEQFRLKEEKYEKYRIAELKKIEYKEIELLDHKIWKEYTIEELFDIKAGVRLTKENMIGGKIPFIGSVDANNGITNFVSNVNNSLDYNVLGVNYNGSVCEVFYHPYKCIFSDDVKHISLRSIKANKYIYLFFKTIIYKQKIKYTYGYKFNENRMKRQIIMVPVNEKKEPDYEYMEQYIKNIMVKKYEQYKAI